MVMRVAARYGQDPFEMEQRRTEDEMDALIAQEHLFMAEHENELNLLAGTGGV